MRLILACSLLSFSSLALAAAPECTDLQVSYDEDGTITSTVPWQEKYRQAPRWNIENAEPPLSIAQAVAVARNWAQAKYPGEQVQVFSITLGAYHCGEDVWWDYWVAIGPKGHSDSVVVLMDGTIAERKDVARKR